MTLPLDLQETIVAAGHHKGRSLYDVAKGLVDIGTHLRAEGRAVSLRGKRMREEQGQRSACSRSPLQAAAWTLAGAETLAGAGLTVVSRPGPLLSLPTLV